jgi:hypothetical protein
MERRTACALAVLPLFLAVNRTHALTRKPAKSLKPARIENISIFLSCQRIAEVVTAELTAASVG